MLTHNINYAIPPDRDEWLDRIERGCVALEMACPFGKLVRPLPSNKSGKVVIDRQRYLKQRLKHSAWLFNLDNGRYGGIRGEHFVDSQYCQVGGRFNQLGEGVYDFSITFQTETWVECERILVAVGDAVEAYYGEVTPLAAMRTIFQFFGVASGCLAYLSRPEDVKEAEKLRTDLEVIGKGLPYIGVPLTDLTHMKPNHPAQPRLLGWLNYWSAATCGYLGFPDPKRNTALLEHSYQMPSGSWIVKLTPEPLDLSRPDHLSIFADTYARFPKLSSRAEHSTLSEIQSVFYPQNTVFIREPDPHYIIDRLVSFLQEQGLRAVEHLPSNGSERTLTIGLLRGDGWTVVKTIPEGFMTEKSHGKNEPRLVDFCNAIRREGFMLNVYNQIEATLLETDGAGQSHISGFWDETPQRTDDLEVLALENPSAIHFELLPIAVDMFNLDDCGQLAQQLYGELAGKNADLCDNERFTRELNSSLFQDRKNIKLYFVQRT